MEYTFDQLAPLKPIVTIGKTEVEISLITLRHHVLYNEKYGSIYKMLEHLREEPIKIMGVIWDLIINKSIFNYNYSDFVNSCLKCDNPAKLGGELRAALDDSIKKSFAPAMSRKRLKDIQDIKKAKGDSVNCYAVYYDTLAARYNYSLDDFYSLTLRQLQILLTTTSDCKYNELEIQAALYGRELKPKVSYEEITDDQADEQDKQAEDALERLRREYEEKKNAR